ncbi:MAG: hypothetical protein LCH80_01290 [Proteobacteria bacterium]|nr:hypothetical protein [Pseudomonadota bacterium]
MFNDIDWSASPDHRTAVHEAGHAIIGRAAGLGCGGAGIIADGTRVGFAEIDKPWFGWRRGDGSRAALIEAYVVAVLAGAEAERYALGAADGGDWSDQDSVHEAITHLRIRGCAFVGDEIWCARTALLRRRSERLVARHWPTITYTALAMVEHRTLDRHQLDALARGVRQ